MALRIRRGLDIERQSIIPAEGEPLYCTDTGMLYIGDGSSVGGQLVTGIKSLLNDPAPALAAPLDLNSHAIVGMGDINIVGDLTVSGNLNIDAVVSDYRGSLYGNDSTLIIDGNNHLVYASVAGLAGGILVDVNTGVINLEYSKLQSLKDVDSTLPMVGSTLTWDGAQWVPSVFGSNSGHVPNQGAILQYDTTAGWRESSFVSADDSTPMFNLQTGEFFLGQTNLESVGNVFIDPNSIEPNHVLTWDGINWTHKEITIDNVQFLGIDLDSLTDVYTPNPDINDLLSWDGNMWVNSTLSIEQLNKVNIDYADVNTNDVLSWDGFNWVSQSMATTINQITLGDLRSVIVEPTLEIGDILAWDGTNWASKSIAEAADLDQLTLGDLRSVIIEPTLEIDDILAWDGTNWVSQPFEEMIGSGSVIGDVLGWNGTKWIPQSMTGSLTAGNNVDDILVWDGSDWNPKPRQIIPTSIFDLDDVTSVGTNKWEILQWNGTNWQNAPLEIGKALDVNLLPNLAIGDSLVWDGVQWTNERLDDIYLYLNQDQDYRGNFQGNIYAEDSSLIINGSTSNIFGNKAILKDLETELVKTNFINSSHLEVKYESDIVGHTPPVHLSVEATENYSVLQLFRSSENDISADNHRYGQIRFGRDDINGRVTSAMISSNRDFIWLGHRSDGAIQDADILFMSNGDLGLGTIAPEAKMDINGSTITRGNSTINGFVQFGSLTTAERDALVAANGMVIYNTTANKFQGYQNGGWINLDDGTIT